MQRTRHWRAALAVVLAITGGAQLSAQGDCLNEFPFGTVTPNSNGTVTEISTCVFFQEYSQINGIVPGGDYELTVTGNGYITVRTGTFDGPVLGQGYSPVQVTALSTATLFAHYTINDACAQSTGCQINTVQRLLNCTVPEVALSYTFDCDNSEYSILVDVLSTGDGTTVDIGYTVDGNANVLPGAGVGVATVGPFGLLDIVDLVVSHETDPDCNLFFSGLQPVGGCPFPITCGAPPASFIYCYDNFETTAWTFQGSGEGSLVLSFIAGTIDAAFADQLVIYDGPDATGAVLYEHTAFQTTELAGLQVVSTSGELHMTLTSDGFGSCADFFLSQWSWTVTCLDCFLPQVAVTSVDDCDQNAFSIEVDVMSTGSAAVVDLVYTVNGGAAQTLDGVAVGIATLGPFMVNDVVDVSLLSPGFGSCDLGLGTFSDNGTCPNLIECGQPALLEAYCYQDNDSTMWLYQSVGTGTLRLRFLRGTIESNTWDQLRIYDGTDNTGAVLFAHETFQTYNLGPAGSAINNTFYPFYAIEVYSTTGSLFMEVQTDGAVQCGGDFPATDFDSWEWEVVCLDCNVPQATVAVVDDCDNNSFSLEVDVTNTGDGAAVNLSYTLNGGDPVAESGVGTGITVLGPFAVNDVVNITVEHESNALCNIPLGNFSDTGTCPTLIDCGTAYDDVLCHGELLDVVYYYQGTGTFPLAMIFNGGSLEDCCDRLFVYDGADVNAPELTPPFGAFGDLTGLFFSSSNPEHRLTMRITTDGSVSCQSGFQTELDWTLSCLDCNPPAATFAIVQDCDNFQYYVDVNVSTLGTDPEVEITNNAGVDATSITVPGIYQVGPFVSGTSVQITLVNDANNLCNLSSATLVNPICPLIVCGGTPVVETYCYEALENRAWAYQLPGTTGTLRLTFNIGTIESVNWDAVRIYDGTDASGTPIFEHTNFDTYNLGPVGSAVNNAIPNYYAVDVTSTTGNLYMTLTSDGSGQCGNPFPSTNFDAWEWEVYCEGCAAPGIAYNLVPNCIDRNYMAEVIVTEAPPAEGVEIENLVTGQIVIANDIGVYEFGPYAQNSPVEFGFTALDNPLCTYFSEELTYNSLDCVIRTCGFDNFTHCYGNDENRWYTFQADAAVPLTLGFLGGQMLPGDRIVVYNGYDENAAVLYQGNNGGNLAGFALPSQNVNNVLTLRIQSNGDGSCADEGATLVPLEWWVACGGVGMEDQGGGLFSVYPNPTDGLLYIELADAQVGRVQLRVMDMSGRTVIENSLNAAQRSTVDLNGLMSGQYLVQLTTDHWVRTRMVQVAR